MPSWQERMSSQLVSEDIYCDKFSAHVVLDFTRDGAENGPRTSNHQNLSDTSNLSHGLSNGDAERDGIFAINEVR